MPIALHNAVDDDESSEASYRRITPAEFAKLAPNTVTPMCSKPCPQIELS